MGDMCTDNHMSSYSSFSDKKPENKNMQYIDITKQKELLELCKLEQSILTAGKINSDEEGYFPCPEDEERLTELIKLQDKYTYGWYIARECLEDQIKSINKFKAYIIEH